MRLGKKIVELFPGTIFCLRPHHVYEASHNPRHRLGVCYTHFDFVDHAGRVIYPPRKDLPPEFVLLDEAEFYERVLRKVAHLSQGDPLQRLEAETFLRGVLLAMYSRDRNPVLTGSKRQHHEMITELTRHIREHPGKLFSVPELAARAGYSPDYFSRLFAAIVGSTPMEFCIRVRLERAQHLLNDSAMTINQIAQALGYADVFFFSRQFKQYLGISPSRWRNAKDGSHGT